MKYRRIDSTYIIRIDRGEEIISSLFDFCEKENIQSGTVTGIGAAENIELKYYNVAQQKYSSKIFKGEFEITALMGSITRMDKRPYIHLHITIGNQNFESFGGHLGSATISGAGEIMVISNASVIERSFDDGTGLNLLDI